MPNAKHELLPLIVFHPIWHQVHCTWMMYVPLGVWILRTRMKAKVASHQIEFGSIVKLPLHKLPLHWSYSIMFENRLSRYTLFSINFSDILECSLRVKRFVACGDTWNNSARHVFGVSIKPLYDILSVETTSIASIMTILLYLLILSVTGNVPITGAKCRNI